MQTRTLEWGCSFLGRGSDLLGTDDGLGGFEDDAPRIRPGGKDKIWDIPTVDGWLSGGLVSLGGIECLRHFEANAVQYLDS